MYHPRNPHLTRQDLAGSLERARAKVKPLAKEKKAGDAGDDNDDDATAQELGLNAEVRYDTMDASHRVEVVGFRTLGKQGGDRLVLYPGVSEGLMCLGGW